MLWEKSKARKLLVIVRRHSQEKQSPVDVPLWWNVWGFLKTYPNLWIDPVLWNQELSESAALILLLSRKRKVSWIRCKLWIYQVSRVFHGNSWRKYYYVSTKPNLIKGAFCQIKAYVHTFVRKKGFAAINVYCVRLCTP